MHDVKIYSTSTCPWCKKAKDYLEEKGVEFIDYNVGEDRDKLQEMMDVSGQRGVPVVVVDDDVIVGFNETKIDQALAA